jgi:hypothetical protein
MQRMDRMRQSSLDGSALRHHFLTACAVPPHLASRQPPIVRRMPTRSLRHFTRRVSSAQRILRLAALGAAALALASASACLNPRTQAATAQALYDAATEIDGLKGDVAQVQSDLDSLRQVVAHQDTVINRLAALNNVPR